ncbi:hypothetical protein L1965_11850 [Paracoccus sp. EGI L200073]|nr:hypothetical protein [Paracoccus salsus]
MLSAFEAFLNDPSAVLPADSINPDPAEFDDSDLSDPALAYLSDDALPCPDTGCIIAVIDDAIPFAHERLRLANGHSRVASIWVQDARCRSGASGSDLPNGIELRGAEIDDYLARARAGQIPGEDAIYRLTGVVDMTRQTTQSTAFAHGHGAAVAMLAAGFPTSDPTGRRHPVIAVNLPPKLTEDSMGTLTPPLLLSSFLFVIHRARRLCRFIEKRQGRDHGSVRLPVVINLSYGVTAGARDGSSLLELFMDAVSQSGAPDLGDIHFVLPTGNGRLERLSGVLSPGDELGWRLPPDDRTMTPLEIWGPTRAGLESELMQIVLTAPGHNPVATAFSGPWQYQTLVSDGAGQEIARAYYTPRLVGDNRWREGITVMINPTCPERLGEPFAPPGNWRIAIAGSAPAGEYEICVQRDEVIRGFRSGARQSWLIDPAYRVHDEAGRLILTDAENGGAPKVLRSRTLNAYAGGRRSLRAGAVDAQRRSLISYCSLLHDGQGGDCLAVVDCAITQPGMVVSGRSSGAFGLLSGTSLAAPQLARWLATQLSAGASVTNRSAIRALAETLSETPGPTPVLPALRQFPEF